MKLKYIEYGYKYLEYLRSKWDYKWKIYMEILPGEFLAYTVKNAELIVINKAIEQYLYNYGCIAQLTYYMLIAHEYRHRLQYHNIVLPGAFPSEREDDAAVYSMDELNITRGCYDYLRMLFTWYVRYYNTRNRGILDKIEYWTGKYSIYCPKPCEKVKAIQNEIL